MRDDQLITPVRGGPTRWFVGAVVALGVLGAAALVPADSRAAAPSTVAESEGLVQVRVQGLDSVYARKDADLARYRKVMLDPIEVSFQRGWDPHVAGTPIPVRHS